MRFLSLIYLTILFSLVLNQSALAAKLTLACPKPEQLQITQGNPNTVSAKLQVLNGNVTPTQMFPELTTYCNKITSKEFSAFYGGVLDCSYTCEYAGGTDELLFYTAHVEEMHPSLKNCRFAEGDAHECYDAENDCKLVCDTK